MFSFCHDFPDLALGFLKCERHKRASVRSLLLLGRISKHFFYYGYRFCTLLIVAKYDDANIVRFCTFSNLFPKKLNIMFARLMRG